ncbi:MAG TPA: transpeptidase family protein [Candidatus Coprenecus stercoravium]|uniref:Transpeptidase family protein n=1 Tax=Candidatus Coprenecus stercoravium TaxID=2840735 RepID=A0A9D2GPU9_9BACT|nr:transpeptidase family protein [Candidatus Coprenecus stercoravium]
MAANVKNTFTRFIYVYILFLLAGVAGIIRIIVLQLDSDRVTTDDIYTEEVLMPSRGSILSYDGRPLAVSIPVFELRWDSKVVNDSLFSADVKALSAGLSRIFRDRSASQYEQYLRNGKRNSKRYLRIGNRDIDFGELEIIQNLPIFRLGQFKGGLIVLKDSYRENPYGRLGYRTIGHMNADGSGTGIEARYDYKLRGEKGSRTIHRTLGDEWLPVNGAPFKPAVDGYDIRTTIDVRIQEATETELRRQLSMSDVFVGATAIVMDVATGAVRGIANMYRNSDGTFDESYDYATGHATEPGSTLKLAALMAMIEDKHITLDTEVDGGDGIWYYGGAKITDTHQGGYGKMTAMEAFEKSSNIAFAKMITESYEDNPSTYVSRLHNMKLLEKLNLDIGGEGYAYITSPDDERWSKSTLASLGYGYAVTLTPLHILTFYNAVANDGRMMRPYFIEDFERDGIVEERSGQYVVSGSICSKSTLKAVRKALRGVVENGTAKICNDSRYAIAGKTGTARVAINGKYEDDNGYRRYQASFAGYFPADDPKYSCIVVLYTGKTRGNFYGATWAAPVFKRIADKIYASHPEWEAPLNPGNAAPPDNPRIASGLAGSKGMPMDFMPMKDRPVVNGLSWVRIDSGDGSDVPVVESMEIEPGIVPDVRGMGLKDAIYLLENEGFKVSFSGAGRVAAQHPGAGTELSSGNRITLTLK